METKADPSFQGSGDFSAIFFHAPKCKREKKLCSRSLTLLFLGILQTLPKKVQSRGLVDTLEFQFHIGGGAGCNHFSQHSEPEKCTGGGCTWSAGPQESGCTAKGGIKQKQLRLINCHHAVTSCLWGARQITSVCVFLWRAWMYMWNS